MQKYIDTVAVKNGARQLTPLVGGLVTVTTLEGAPAEIFDANGGLPRSSPLLTDINGAFSFYAVDGRYTITITGNGIVPITISDVLLEDPVDGAFVIVDGAIVEAKIGAGAVTTPKIIDGAVTAPKLANNAVTNVKVAAGAAIDAAKLSMQLSGTGAVVQSIFSILKERVSVLQFGADPTGVLSSRVPFENACLYCYLTGATLVVPAGNYREGRVEVHGSFDVEGHGLPSVEYLGVGTTYIAGTGSGATMAPTPWPIDTGYDPSGRFTPVMYSIAAPISPGAASFSVNDPTGLTAGMILFIGGAPTSASSATNYIPSDFEFVRILSVAGGVVNIQGKFKNGYGPVGVGAGAAAAFYSPGLATNCKVSGLKITTAVDAYQWVVRSAFNVELSHLEFAGESSCGACTFSELLHINHWKVWHANGPISTARGTVSAVIENVEYMENFGGPTGLFVEESFYRIVLRNFNARNSAFSIRSLALPESGQKRSITIEDSIFDARSSETSPMQCGTASGVDFHALRSTFAGKVTTPNAGQYPGINGLALIWVSSTLASDTYRFTDCKFISTNAGATWPLTADGAFGGIGGFLGDIEFNSGCTFDVCSNAHFRPWIATLTGSTAAPTVPVSVTAYYTKQGKNIDLWWDFQSVNTTGATGNVEITGQPFPAANNGINYVGASVTANLGSLPTVGLIQPNSTKILLLNSTSYSQLAMVSGTGKFASGNIKYVRP